MTDDIEQRLRSADPAPAPRQGQPAAPWIRDLVEATMTTTTERPRVDERPRQRSRRLAVAACGVAAVALSAGLYVSTRGPAASEAARPAVPAVQLALAKTDPSASCLPFSVDTLRTMPLAFSGSVTSIDGGVVRLTVDHWYRGGASAEVLLRAPADVDAALVGAVPFEQGQRYLVSATGGAVSSCGLTGAWDPQFEAAFREAFGG